MRSSEARALVTEAHHWALQCCCYQLCSEKRDRQVWSEDLEQKAVLPWVTWRHIQVMTQCSTLPSCHLGCGSSPPFIKITRQEKVTDAGKNITAQRNGTTLTGRVSLCKEAQTEKKHAGKFSTFLENKFSVFWVSVLQQLEGQSRRGNRILWDQRRLLELVLFLTRCLAWMANDLLGEKN